MTTEEKAKAYDEALEKARANYKADKEMGFLGNCDMLELIFPELKESEDERIRKSIVETIKQCTDILEPKNQKRMLDWLERQKVPSMSATEVLVRAGLKPYKDGDQWCILAGDNIQEGICGFGDTIDDALYQFLMEVFEKQKEQKSIQTEDEKEYVRIIKSLIADFVRDKKPEDVADYQRIYDWLDGRHIEQKPAEINEYEIIKKHITEDSLSSEVNKRLKECGWYVTDEKPAERQDYSGLNDLEGAIHRGFLSAGVENVPATIIKETAQECLSHIDKPTEWGEEDEKKIIFLERLIRYNVPEGQYGWIDGHIGKFVTKLEAISMLKSLRPSWKPSEEHLQGLRRALTHVRQGSDAWNSLSDLYEHLQKLLYHEPKD